MDLIFTPGSFNSLSNPEKFGQLETYGVYLEVFRLFGPYKIALFDLEGMYVEVYLNQKTDEISRAVAIEDLTRLDVYLESINIGRLLKDSLRKF